MKVVVAFGSVVGLAVGLSLVGCSGADPAGPATGGEGAGTPAAVTTNGGEGDADARDPAAASVPRDLTNPPTEVQPVGGSSGGRLMWMGPEVQYEPELRMSPEYLDGAIGALQAIVDDGKGSTKFEDIEKATFTFFRDVDDPAQDVQISVERSGGRFRWLNDRGQIAFRKCGDGAVACTASGLPNVLNLPLRRAISVVRSSDKKVYDVERIRLATMP